MQLKKKSLPFVIFSFDQENTHLSSPDFRQVLMFSFLIAPVEGCTLFTQYFLCAGSMIAFFHSKSVLGIYTHP